MDTATETGHNTAKTASKKVLYKPLKQQQIL